MSLVVMNCWHANGFDNSNNLLLLSLLLDDGYNQLYAIDDRLATW